MQAYLTTLLTDGQAPTVHRDRETLPVLSQEPDPLLSAHRLAESALNHLGVLGVPVRAEVQEDGQVSLTLPLPWAHLFLNTLATQAHAYKEQLRKAAMQERMKQAERKARSHALQVEVAERDRTLYEAYLRLRKRGLTDTEAVDRLRDPDPDSLFHGKTVIQGILREQAVLARRTAQVKKLDLPREQICALYRQGLKPKQIARTLNLSRWDIYTVLTTAHRQGQITRLPQVPRTPVSEAQRAEILTLVAQGVKPQAIAPIVGVHVHQVYDTVYKAGKKLRPGGAHD